MLGDGVVGEGQRVRPGQAALLHQKGRKAAVQVLIKDLVQQPHHVGKPAGDELGGEVRHRGRLAHQLLVHRRGDAPEHRVLLGLHRDVELQAVQHAVGAHQAHVPAEQPVEGDLPPVLREREAPQLAAHQHQQAHTVGGAVVDDFALFHMLQRGGAFQLRLLLARQLLPEGQIFPKLHAACLPCRSFTGSKGPDAPAEP